MVHASGHILAEVKCVKISELLQDTRSSSFFEIPYVNNDIGGFHHVNELRAAI